MGLLQIDTATQVVYTNDRLHEIVGVARAATAQTQLATIIPTDRPALELAIKSVLEEGSHADIEVACGRPDGKDVRYCTLSFRSLRHEDGRISGAIACVADVTEAARTREELKFRATFDQLTKCLNRASIVDALKADIARDRPSAERAVMFVDLDGFKLVNDRLGHSVGDRLLHTVAQALQESVRRGDLVGRRGGDEFLIICPDVGGAKRAMALADRLSRTLREEMFKAAENSGCAASIGVAWSSGRTTGADALVSAADKAMYESKLAGTGEPILALTRAPSAQRRRHRRAAVVS